MAETKKSAKAALSALKAEMAKPHITASALAAMQRELVLIHQGSFHGYVCSVCGNRFLGVNPATPNDISLFETLSFFREQRKEQFAAHVCRKIYEHPVGF